MADSWLLRAKPGLRASPVIRRDRDRPADAGAAREAFVISGVLGGEHLALFLGHWGEVFFALQHTDSTEAAQGDAVARLAEPQPGLENGIEEVGFVDDLDLAA